MKGTLCYYQLHNYYGCWHSPMPDICHFSPHRQLISNHDHIMQTLMMIMTTIMSENKTAATYSRQCYLMIHSWSRLSPGILVIGSKSTSATRSVEFWSLSDPEEGSCELDDYPRSMGSGPTANLVSGQLVACFYDSCEIYNGGGEWNHLVDTSSSRIYHSSAVKDDDRILLIGGGGGDDSRSTEWISVDGSPSQPGPFHVRHGQQHCTIQLSSDLVLVTGGLRTGDYVTSYHLSGNGDEASQTSLNRGRAEHACGVYQDAGGQQVRRPWIHLIQRVKLWWRIMNAINFHARRLVSPG